MIQEQELEFLLQLVQTHINFKQQNKQIPNAQKENTLDQICQQFNKQFGTEIGSTYNPCQCLLAMLQDNLLTESSRLIAIYLIIEGYKTQDFIKSNPFALFIIEILIESTSYQEQWFIDKCINQNEREILGKLNITQIIQRYEQQHLQINNIEQYQQIKQQLLDNQPKLGISECEINKIICDFNRKDKQVQAPKVNIEAGQIPQEELNYEGFPPDYFRPLPEFIPIDHEEYQWVNPGLAPDLLWNYNNNINQSAIVKELMDKAFQSQLQKEEIKILEDAFKQDPKLIAKSGINPVTLTNLVEKNVQISSTILIQLSRSYPDQLNSYFENLAHMELTLSSLEVVNTLVQKETVPNDFLNYYICNCIQQCEEYKKDKTNQNRLVRLVCAFIKSLIKNKTINPKDMYIELQAFCIEFSKVSEASQLFKILKQLPTNNTGKQQSGSNGSLNGKNLSNGGNK